MQTVPVSGPGRCSRGGERSGGRHDRHQRLRSGGFRVLLRAHRRALAEGGELRVMVISRAAPFSGPLSRSTLTISSRCSGAWTRPSAQGRYRDPATAPAPSCRTSPGTAGQPPGPDRFRHRPSRPRFRVRKRVWTHHDSTGQHLTRPGERFMDSALDSPGHHRRRRERLLYLLITGVVVLLADFMFLSARLRGRGCSPAR